MLWNFKKLLNDNGIAPNGVIQIGSHFFQEKEDFINAGIKNFVLIEPQKHAFEQLKERAKDLSSALLYNVAISNFNGTDVMLCSDNDGQSSSLLVPKEHQKEYPGVHFTREETVQVWKLDNLGFDREKYNILYMDIQGNELNALKGMEQTLFWIDCIYTEVNFKELYEDCGLLSDLEKFLAKNNFHRIAIGPEINGWSDAFYVKK
jgi:FkbM family methyltransferase